MNEKGKLELRRGELIIGHFDVHGVTAAIAAHRKYGGRVFARFPDTAPERILHTLTSLLSSGKQEVLMVDIPIDLKAPDMFINGLEKIAEEHDITITYIDHHATSLPFLHKFLKVKAFYYPSAYLMTKAVASPDNIGETLALIGGIADRDPEVIKRGLYTPYYQRISDGLDVLLREKNTDVVVMEMLRDVEVVFQKALEEEHKIPMANIIERINNTILCTKLPEGWGPKALERAAFREDATYAVGHEFATSAWSPHCGQWAVRAIVRWDKLAMNPDLELPGNTARKLWPNASIIGHSAAPSIGAENEEKAKKMAKELALALAQ